MLRNSLGPTVLRNNVFKIQISQLSKVLFLNKQCLAEQKAMFLVASGKYHRISGKLCNVSDTQTFTLETMFLNISLHSLSEKKSVLSVSKL